MILAVCRRISIVLENDELAARALGYHITELEILEIQVIGKLDDAGRTVDRTRAADADPRHVVECKVCLTKCIFADVNNGVAENFLRAGNRRLARSLCDDRVVFVHDTDGNVCTAYVYTKIIHNTNSFSL